MFTIVNSLNLNSNGYLLGAFSLVRDKLNERLRKLFEAKTVNGQQSEPKIFDSVRDVAD